MKKKVDRYKEITAFRSNHNKITASDSKFAEDLMKPKNINDIL